MIKFSVLKYSIIYSLMAQTTLAVQTVERVSGSGEGKYRLTHQCIWSACALSCMYIILQLEGL